jgi:hypothetical protein
MTDHISAESDRQHIEDELSVRMMVAKDVMVGDGVVNQDSTSMTCSMVIGLTQASIST